MSTPTCLPASLTKHLPTISHPLPRQCFTSQSNQDESDMIVRLRQISSSSSSSFSSTTISPNRAESSRTDNPENQPATAVASTGTTGTTLWLGGQLMSCYIAETLPNGFVVSPAANAGESQSVGGLGGRRSKRVLELGGGVGFLSLVLASLGYRVTTTDISPSFEDVLVPNITNNTTSIRSKADASRGDSEEATGGRADWGKVITAKLDWFDYIGTVEEGRTKALEWILTHDPSLPPNSLSSTSESTIIPYDMIITTDTLYSPLLTLPLLSTLRSFSLLSLSSSPPPIYVALETRDPALIAHSLALAKEMGFSLKKIALGRVDKALGKSGWGWEDREEWEGIEIWKWKYGG